MANAVWPAELPQAPLVSGLEETLPDLTVRSQPDLGPAITRARFSAGVTPVTITLKMTRGQLTTFWAFFLDSIAGGALPFDWKDHRTKADRTYRITSQPKTRPGAPGLASQRDVWTVTFTAEMLPASTSTTLVVVPQVEQFAADAFIHPAPFLVDDGLTAVFAGALGFPDDTSGTVPVADDFPYIFTRDFDAIDSFTAEDIGVQTTDPVNVIGSTTDTNYQNQIPNSGSP